MAGLDIALLTGRSSLLLQQTKLAVTGNNIANANTVGYHRQTVSASSAAAIANTKNWLGTGVQIEDVVRTYDQALERNLRQTTCQDGYYQTYASHLDLLEGIVAPNGDSPVAQAVTDFAASLAALDADPSSLSARNAVIASGTNLADQINRTRASLVSLSGDIAGTNGKGELADGVAQVNQLAKEIASLNQQITATEQRLFNPQQANDLRDRREQLMGELSRLADVEVTEQSDGSWDLGIGGTSLVSGTTVNSIAVQMNAGGPSLVWAASGAAVSQDGGQLQGLVDADSYIRSSIAELDNFASALADTMNTQHAAGFDSLGVAGGDLFDATTPGGVSFVVTQPSRLAAAGTAGATADSVNARALYDAMASSTALLDGDSLLSRPDRLVDSIAMDTASASALAEGTAAGIDMFRDAIGQVSGVNMDEEMMTMLETQRAYQASARFVGVIDEMLAETLQMVG